MIAYDSYIGRGTKAVCQVGTGTDVYGTPGTVSKHVYGASFQTC